jgi:hypothetical protein
MLVKCIASLPDDEQAKILGIGKHYYPGQMEFNVQIGQEYVVFGISFLTGAPWIFILSQSKTYTYLVPLCLFETIDGRVSKYWVAKVDQDGDFFLWPPSFYQPYYHDDLSEGVPDVAKDFQRVRQLIMEENSSNIEPI